MSSNPAAIIANYKKTIDKLHNQMAHNKTMMDNLNLKKDTEIQVLKKTLEDCKNAIYKKDLEFDKTLEELKNTSKQKDLDMFTNKTLEDCKNEVTFKNRYIDELKDIINKKDLDIFEFTQTVKSLNAQLDNFRSKIYKKTIIFGPNNEKQHICEMIDN
jgi:hypothetical protein